MKCPKSYAALFVLFSSLCTNLWASSDAATSTQFDGPAELPRVSVQSTLADTPAPGHVHLVKEGENLQRAIDAAACGDTLKLQAGAIFTGLFRLSNKSCDDAHWIILRTSADDNAIPAEGKRLTPCYAGVASLPGRPDYHCSAPRNVIAKIEFAGKTTGPFLFLPGASHYRFIGLEITRANSDASIVALAAVEEGGTANHIIFDRVWVHGTAQSETRRGIYLSAMRYAAVVDSYFSDFHCISVSGACTDSQTVSAGGGDNPEGPFKIENNFLEAAGENLIFGGRRAETTPADIEIRRNHLFKPLIWMPGQPGFVGGADGHPFIVKNHFELKNAQRVLFEDNLLENSWGGFTQTGFSIILMPTSQGNQCPSCMVTDVTIRSIKIINVGSGFTIANVPSDTGGFSSEGGRYSIHDILIEAVRGKDYQGFGNFALVISKAPRLHDVQIAHVTSSSVPRYIISILGLNPQKMSNFIVANNIFSSDQAIQIGSAGDPRNCADRPDKQGPQGVFNSCFENSTFTHNIVAGGANWPPGNIMVKDYADAGIRRIHDSGTLQFQLCKEKEDGCKKRSPAIAAGTDGKNIGADVDAIEKVMKEII